MNTQSYSIHYGEGPVRRQDSSEMSEAYRPHPSVSSYHDHTLGSVDETRRSSYQSARVEPSDLPGRPRHVLRVPARERGIDGFTEGFDREYTGTYYSSSINTQPATDQGRLETLP
jgi:hypothetical protein